MSCHVTYLVQIHSFLQLFVGAQGGLHQRHVARHCLEGGQVPSRLSPFLGAGHWKKISKKPSIFGEMIQNWGTPHHIEIGFLEMIPVYRNGPNVPCRIGSCVETQKSGGFSGWSSMTMWKDTTVGTWILLGSWKKWRYLTCQFNL